MAEEHPGVAQHEAAKKGHADSSDSSKIDVKPGALHRQLGIKQGQKIPHDKLEELKEHGTPLEKKRANFALNAESWNKK